MALGAWCLKDAGKRLPGRSTGFVCSPHVVRRAVWQAPVLVWWPGCAVLVQDRNAILADEMGLGKTVQCVSLVGLLSQHMLLRGPFLVVVPLSTVPNWIKEFRKWVPMVSCCVRHVCGALPQANRAHRSVDGAAVCPGPTCTGPCMEAVGVGESVVTPRGTVCGAAGERRGVRG